jgi:hypothetical protein
MKLLERQPSYVPPMEETREAVREALIGERAAELARQAADALLEEIKAGKSLEDIAEIRKAQVEETGMFSRNSAIPKLGRPQPFVKEVFRMRVGDTRVVDLLNQPAVVVLKERETFDPEAYEKEKAQLRQRVLRQRREQTFAEWSNDVRQQAEEEREIAINQSVLAVL